MGRGCGLIGKALSKKTLPPGVYFFNSVSSITLFKDNMDWCFRETLNEFIDVISYCKRTNTYLVFPSSATVYNKNTAYARCKAAIEEIYQAYDYPALGLRIAASYGPDEGHKGEAASVIYQWAQQMKRGERPVIYGDGTQTRDFIYIDDVADNIERLANEHATGLVDIGTGTNTSFNEVVSMINKILDTNIEPIYIPKPVHYVPETPVTSVPCKVDLYNGLRKILLE